MTTLSTLVSTLTATGQNVEFKAIAPAVVEVGEQFRLSYTLNQNGTNLKVPTLEGFNLLMGPSTSTSSSVSVVNGHVTQSSNYTYTYVCVGVKKGVYKIPPATVLVDGKTYSTNALQIEVIEGTGQQGGQGNRAQSAQPAQSTQPAQSGGGGLTNENLFVEVSVDRRNLFIGEGLVATIKVYTKVQLVNLGPKYPSFSGFLVEEIPGPQQIELVRQNYNGSVYNVGVIRKVLLIPQHTGEIVIEPFELECVVRQQLSQSRNFFDDFFGNVQDVRIKKLSRPITVKVNELPSGKPVGFKGAVGRIALKNTISAETVKAGEAITYKVVFSGNGNLKLLEAPTLNIPPDIDMYDPKINKNVKTDGAGMSGTVSFEYVLIPRYGGDYTIPAPTYSVFDPDSKTYKILRGQDFTIHVEKGDGQGQVTDNSGPLVQSFKQEGLRKMGDDIRYIKTGDLDLQPKGTFFFGTVACGLSYLVPFLIFVIAALFNRQRIKANSDLIRQKNKVANKMAQKRMKLAAKALKARNSETFYDEVLKALWGYVSYKLNIDQSELNRDNISSILEQKSVDKALIDNFIKILDDCEFARYAPGGNTEEKLDEVYKDSVDIITKLDKAIR
ncbi:hypothetical protein FACS1894195_4790 [Bacteroidia bacterium]|nr:hypothetical protein FACS1894195_4790 [Bacteroidia bacterium]